MSEPLVVFHKNECKLKIVSNDNTHPVKKVSLKKQCSSLQVFHFIECYRHSLDYRRLVESNLMLKLFPHVQQITIRFVIVDYNVVSIDRSWYARVVRLVLWRMELEDSLSWLSTLGGAFSCLGDRNLHFAKKAGEISMKQLGLSRMYGDPNLISRCYIFICHSLCQQNARRLAIRMIRQLVHPYLVEHGHHCDRIVKGMYRALCYRIQFIYKK